MTEIDHGNIKCQWPHERPVKAYNQHAPIVINPFTARGNNMHLPREYIAKSSGIL